MKFIKKIFYGICILLLLICGIILLCAFQPSLTQTLADFLYGRQSSSVSEGDADSLEEGLLASEGSQGTESGTEQGEPSGTESGTGQGEPSGTESGTGQGEPSGTGGSVGDENGLRQLPDSGYQPSQEGSVSVPTEVAGRNGYIPVQENAEEIDESQARDLQEQTSTGETGDELTFDSSIYPYYGMLGTQQQKLYRQIYANAQALNKNFVPVVQTTVAQMKSVFEAVCNDHPELFWLNTGYTCKYLSGGQCVEIILSFNATADNQEQSQKLFDEKAEAILSQVRMLESDYEKERYIHNALIKQAKYNLGAAMNQSAYSALVNGDTVCAGYARAYQYLMQQAGIPCYYCTGYSGEDHAWNIVGLEGEYYNVDVTWDDTDPATYDYFNKTDADFASTHVRKGLSVYLPACRGTTYGNLETEESAAAQIEMTEGRMSLEELGYTQDMVVDTLSSYYDDCYRRINNAGLGTARFQLVVGKDLWAEVEAAYSSGAYKSGFADRLVTDLKAASCTFWIQGEELQDGSVLTTHVVEIE